MCDICEGGPLTHTYYEVEDSDQLESLTAITSYPAVPLI